MGLLLAPESPTATAEVQARIDEGAHHIKVIIEDMSMFQDTRTPKLPVDILEAVVAESHAAGLKVVAHVVTLAAGVPILAGPRRASPRSPTAPAAPGEDFKCGSSSAPVTSADFSSISPPDALPV